LKSEILYETKIHPSTMIFDLNEDQIKQICVAFQEIASKAYQLHGASFSNYEDVNGKKGNFQNFFKVYRQKTDPNGNTVKKTVSPDGRSTYFSTYFVENV